MFHNFSSTKFQKAIISDRKITIFELNRMHETNRKFIFNLKQIHVKNSTAEEYSTIIGMFYITT